MPRLAPVDWRTLVKVFEADGFVHERTHGSHIVLVKPGVARAVVVPRYSQIRADILLANLRTAGMSRQRYFELLRQLK
jgi:predicted RNA binding protein YcfA (HicA-like mRNA interferase family)